VKPLPLEDLNHICAHTYRLWESAREKRLFITGGTGFFGTWLLESFVHCNRELSLNAEAIVLTRDPSAYLSKASPAATDRSVKFLTGDVRTFTFPGHPIDFVIHAAAPTSAHAASQPMDLLGTIVHGTERVVELARTRRVQAFLLVSSGAVYGRQPKTISHIREDYLGGPDWLDTNSAYAEGKRVSEQICSINAKENDVRFVIARCFAFVGPHLPLNQHFAIGNFIGDALAGNNISIRGDGTPMRSYLYAADLAIWLWTMLLRDSEPEENPAVYNVGSSEAIAIQDLARIVVEELDPSLQIQIAQQAQMGQGPEQYIPDVKKAETSLGLRPIIGLREAIRRTAAWAR
jgi:nucleoside-diphosphate-sugar epimerase